MCTVTFIPTKDQVFITSNRDEKWRRKSAIHPQLSAMNTCHMIFPKDGDTNGTWISLSDNGNAAVLLNGAFENHTKKEKYSKSRGLVFLELTDHKNPVRNFFKYPLSDVEPFTLILWQSNNLYECRWDENGKRFCRPLAACRPHIWSSATLYNAEVRKRRELWFAKWLNNHPVPKLTDVLNFHRFTGDGNRHHDLFMNRDGKVFTVSITSLALTQNAGVMHYTDLQTEVSSSLELSLLGYQLIRA